MMIGLASLERPGAAAKAAADASRMAAYSRALRAAVAAKGAGEVATHGNVTEVVERCDVAEPKLAFEDRQQNAGGE